MAALCRRISSFVGQLRIPTFAAVEHTKHSLRYIYMNKFDQHSFVVRYLIFHFSTDSLRDWFRVCVRAHQKLLHQA